MNKRIIRSSSFPDSFLRLFHYVASTTKPITVNNLDNNKSAYINLRARLNEFRKAYHQEAVASGNPHLMELADSLYGVVCRDPKQVDGKWELKLEHKNAEFGQALDDLLPAVDLPEINIVPGGNDAIVTDLPDTPVTPEEALPKGTGDVATKAISELFDNDAPDTES